MSEHDPFEQDLREVMDGLASEPAPDELRARIAAIPRLEPAPRRWGGIAGFFRARGGGIRALSTLAAAAVLVVAAALVIATLPGSGNRPGGQGGAPAISPGGAAGSPAASSGSQVVVVTSPGPSSAPSASPMPAGVPAGFQAASVTFVSPSDGWALGTGSCGSSSCVAVVHTTDGGRTWTAVAAPAAAFQPMPPQPGSGAGVNGIRFASATDGWAFGPSLWATHDGGATWTQVSIPGLGSGAQVVALETSAGTVQAVVYDGNASYRIASSPIGSNSWQLSAVKVPVGAGPVPQIQLVLSGSSGWMVEVDRVVVGGARLTNGTWSSWTPPCATAMGPAIVAASTSTDLVAECDGGVWGTPQDAGQTGNHLYVSHDGGSAFTQSSSPVPLTEVGEVAAPANGTIVLAGSTGTSPVPAIDTSTNGGASWTTFGLPAGASVTYLGFTTASQGVAIVQAGTQSHLYMTYDGGGTWSDVSGAAG